MLGDDSHSEGSGLTKVEKALVDIRSTRTQLAKSDVSPGLTERLHKAEDDLAAEILCKGDTAHGNRDSRRQIEQNRQIELGGRRAA